MEWKVAMGRGLERKIGERLEAESGGDGVLFWEGES